MLKKVLNRFIIAIAYIFLAFIIGGNQVIFGMRKMISKLAKAKNNWFFKIISILVAVSFVSLFGVAGYINSASQNQTIVNVSGKKTTQSEFSYRLQKELNALKNLAGDDFEISEETRNALADNVIRQIVNESVLDQTMQQYDIYFPRAFIQQVVFSQPEFKNPANGQFHPELFKRYLAAAGLNEAEYLNIIKRIMAQKLLVTDLTYKFNIPAVLSNAIHKMDNQRKSFKYVTVSPKDIKIERQISDDEIKQYYEDFAENFTVPETRTVNMLFIPNEAVLKKYAATDEMIEDYFKQHKSELDQPEKREVLQMVFMQKETAEKALESLHKTGNFAQTAKEFKAENADEPTLGVVAEDELANELALAAFEAKPNEPKLLQVADTWQIINVKDVIPAKEAVLTDMKPQIIELLNNENLYEALREARAELDDAVNGGKSLAEAGALLGATPVTVTGITEETPVADIRESLRTLDFNEMVFSYGKDEFSSAEEFDDGIVMLQVTDIVDAHQPEIDLVKDKIIELWTVQEKSALAKETAENIANDVEDGSDFADAAKARGLDVFRSAPINRNETFANLTETEVNDLFLTDDSSVKVFEHSNNQYIIAVPFETVNYQDELTDDVLKSVQERATRLISADMNKAALDRYAEDFKIKIDYERAGFSE